MGLLGAASAAVGIGRAVGDVIATSLASVTLSAAADGLAATQSAAAVIAEAAGAPPARRFSGTGNTRWIEVRGLGSDGKTVADAVISALRDVPGVTRVHINGPIARAVVTVADGGPTPQTMAKVVARAEASCGVDEHRPELPMALSLPGDDAYLASRLAATLISSAGFGAAFLGGLLPMRGLPALLTAPVAVADPPPTTTCRGWCAMRSGSRCRCP